MPAASGGSASAKSAAAAAAVVVLLVVGVVTVLTGDAGGQVVLAAPVSEGRMTYPGDGANPDIDTFAAPGGAHVVSSNRVNDQILDLTVYSPALGHNTRVRLLLPPGWSSNPGKSWPTLYLLPGYHHAYGYRLGDYDDWTHHTDIEQFMAGKNVLTVLPSGGGAGFFTNWWNGGNYGTPQWETYHTRELPALLESAFGASSNRAVAGLSLAGYGAVEYAADNPGMYNGVASYSGVLHTTFPGVPAVVKRMWKSAGIAPERVWGDPYAHRGIWRANNPWAKAGRLCGTGTSLYLSAGSGIPGEHDPPLQRHAQDLLRSLQRNPAHYFNSYGQATLIEAAAAVTTRLFETRLRAMCTVGTVSSIVTGEGGGIDITTDYTLTGTHRWGYWEDAFHRSWPVLAKSLGLPVD